MRVVDAHVHVFPPEVGQHRERFCGMDRYFAVLYGSQTVKLATVEDLIGEMDRADVSVAVMCGFGWSSIELCAFQNDYMLDCLRRYPDRLVALAALQPTAGDAAIVELERCLSGGMKGVGELMPDGQGFRLSETLRLTPLMQAAAELGFPVMTHCSEPLGHIYPGKGTATPGEIWKMVGAFPSTKFILAHWGGGYPFYELMREVRASSGNVYYDSAASTYLYDTRIFQLMQQIVDPDRMLWGSDYPVLGQSRFLERIAALEMGDKERAALLGGNAKRLFGIAE